MLIESAYHIFSHMKTASKNRKKPSPETKRLQREKEGDNHREVSSRERGRETWVGKKGKMPDLTLE